MALEAQRANVVEVTFPAAFNDGCDVVGIPEALSKAAAGTPGCQGPLAGSAAGSADSIPFGYSVEPTRRADAAVPSEYLRPQISGVGTKAPLMYTPRGAERTAWRRHFEIAPAAQSPAVRTPRQVSRGNISAAHGTPGAQREVQTPIVSGTCRRQVLACDPAIPRGFAVTLTGLVSG
jgi:hypothetical protein